MIAPVLDVLVSLAGTAECEGSEDEVELALLSAVEESDAVADGALERDTGEFALRQVVSSD